MRIRTNLNFFASTTAVAALILCCGPAALAQSQKLSAQDRNFLMDAAKGNMTEIHLGMIAIDRGTTRGVKDFGQRLVTDHTANQQKLDSLAGKLGVKLPGDDAKMVNSMPIASESGTTFDHNFAKIGVEDHEQDIAKFEKEISSGTNSEVKDYARETLPTLKEHLQIAEQLPK